VKGTPELGPQVAIDILYQNDVWEFHQNLATMDIPKNGLRRTGFVRSYHKNAAHPAAFPTALPRGAINYLTGPSEIVYEPFSGSGSTIIACEQLRRTCYGMEIVPGYLAVTLERYQDATGETPRLFS
jgi:DNA modification methylase